jgi:hypothetical protein
MGGEGEAWEEREQLGRRRNKNNIENKKKVYVAKASLYLNTVCGE